MNNVDLYLNYDSAARRGTMFGSIVAGGVAGAVAELFNVQFNAAVAICILATGLVEVIKALRYVGTDRKDRRAMIYFPARRVLLRSAFATGVLLVLFSLRIP